MHLITDSHCFIVSQSFIYIIALRNVQQNMQPASYIELRKLLDKNFQSKFRIVLYTGFVTGSILTVLCSMNPGSLLFITAAIGLIALIVEIIIAVKGNVPINRIINTWSPENYPGNWTVYRAKWLSVFAIRQIVNITGFVSLLVGAVFES